MDPLFDEDPFRVGPYRLIARLGAGGMGRVYLARSEGGRTVAVKVVQADLAQQPEFRRRFAQEVMAARKVAGVWTAPVLDADTEAPVPWVATGYVPGPDLHRVVSGHHGPLPERSVRALANGLAHALQAIHDGGLIHRDLKPSNVLITVDGPRVIDFGIARALDTVAGEPRTRTGVVIGSPGFMSPEQVRAEKLTPASDVFCLGSVLAYASTGRPPFGAADSGPHALMFRITAEEPQLDGVPDSLLDLVRACLAKDPERRPTPQDVVAHTPADLTAWLPGEVLGQLGRHAAQLLDLEPSPPPPAVPVMPPLPPSPPAPPAAHPPVHGGRSAPVRRRTRALLAGALAVLVIAGGSGLLALRPWEKGDAFNVPSAFIGTWEGMTNKEEGTAHTVFTRLEIAADPDDRQAAELSWLEGDRLCVWEYALASAGKDADEGQQRLTLDDGRVKRAVPESESGACPKPPRSTLMTRTVDGGLDWAGGAYKITFSKQKPPSRTPMPDGFAGRWNVENHSAGPDAAAGIPQYVEVGGGPIDTSDIVLHYRMPDGRDCAYKGQAFSVRGGVLGLAVLEPIAPSSAPDCPRKRPTLVGTIEKTDDMRLRSSDLKRMITMDLHRVSP